MLVTVEWASAKIRTRIRLYRTRRICQSTYINQRWSIWRYAHAAPEKKRGVFGNSLCANSVVMQLRRYIDSTSGDSARPEAALLSIENDYDKFGRLGDITIPTEPFRKIACGRRTSLHTKGPMRRADAIISGLARMREHFDRSA